MFCMGQNQSQRMELEDKVVKSQPDDVPRAMEVPQIGKIVVLMYINIEKC